MGRYTVMVGADVITADKRRVLAVPPLGTGGKVGPVRAASTGLLFAVDASACMIPQNARINPRVKRHAETGFVFIMCSPTVSI